MNTHPSLAPASAPDKRKRLHTFPEGFPDLTSTMNPHRASAETLCRPLSQALLSGKDILVQQLPQLFNFPLRGFWHLLTSTMMVTQIGGEPSQATQAVRFLGRCRLCYLSRATSSGGNKLLKSLSPTLSVLHNIPQEPGRPRVLLETREDVRNQLAFGDEPNTKWFSGLHVWSLLSSLEFV